VRKQGAGLVNITKSYTTAAYVVTYDACGNAMDKTKLELGDDKNKSGEYNMTFSVKNITDGSVAYDLSSVMITEGVSETYTGHSDTTVTQDGYLLAGTQTKVLSVEGGTQDGNKITVGARGSAKVSVRITLSAEDKAYLDKSFKNGMYVEGFVTLKAASGTNVSLNVPVLAFYGDWTKAPIFDEEYYDTNVDELNEGIDDDDKLMPDAYATRVIGGLYSDYIVSLGSYYFDQNPSLTPIAANKDHIAISNQKSSTNFAVSSIRSVSAGLLRNAKRVDISIVEDATGKEIFTRSEYNVRKSMSYGSDMYGTSIDVEFDTLEHDLKNNTRYTVTLTAYIDYGEYSEQKNDRNVFTFPLYIDFEAPVVTDVKYRTEYDSTTKKTTYYADLSVYDNHYSMGISLGQIVPAAPGSEYAFELNSFNKYMIPVYSSYNSTSTVTMNITDYIAEMRNSAGIIFNADGSYRIDENNNSFIVAIYDYAMNSGIYQLRLPDEFLSLAFNKDEVEIKENKTLKIADVLDFYPQTSWISTLDFEVPESSRELIEVVNQTIFAKKSGDATVIAKGRDNDGNEITATLKVKVLPSDSGSAPSGSATVSKFEISGYTVEKAFYSVSSSEREIGVDGGKYSFGKDPSLSMYPSETVQVHCTLDSYFPDDVTIKYVSSSDDIVIVSQDGRITAIAKGDATIFVDVLYKGKTTNKSGTINIKVKDPFETLSIYLNSYRGLGGYVEIPSDRGITIINSYAFSGYEYVDKDLSAGDVIDDEDPYYIKQSALSEHTITKIKIPEGVTTIEESAFANLTELVEVELPASLVKIGRNAFRNCAKLTTINLDHVKFINERAFSGCNLSTANLSEIVAIGNYAFENCKFTNVLTLPKCSQSLGEGAFYGNADLKEVKFEANKIKIAKRAFENCGLVSIKINAAVISAYAFYNCKDLDDVTLGKDVSIIGECAFAGTKVSSFNLDGGNKYFITAYNGAMLLTKDGKEVALVAPNYRARMTLTLDDGVESIGSGAFSGSLATRVVAPNVNKVGNYAFAGCADLTSVSLNAVEKIGDYAFAGAAISSADYLSGAKEIGAYAFYRTQLTSVNIGDGCKIGDHAFAECDRLTSVTLGNDVTVGAYAFYSPITLYVYDENAGVSNVLDDKEQDNGVEADSVLSYEEIMNILAHYTRDLTEEGFEDYKYRMSDGARSSLVTVTAGDNVVFGEYAFAGNSKITSLALGQSAKIGDYAFYNDYSLTIVNAEKVIEVGDYAFSGLYTRDLRYYQDAFGYAYIDEYDEYGNLIYRKAKYTCFAPKFASFDLSYATKIGKGAFAYNDALNEIIIADNENVTEIPDDAFAGCSGLTEFDFGGNMTAVGAYAFYGTSLDTADLGGVSTIGKYAFADTKLVALILHDGAVISDGAFAYCHKLTTAEGLDKAVYIGANALSGAAIAAIDVSGAEYIGDYAFANSAATSVIFGENLVSLGENPFYNCDGLETFGKVFDKVFNGDVVESALSENYDVSATVKVINGALYQNVATGLELISYPMGRKADDVKVEEGTTRISARAFAGSSLINVELPSTLLSLGDKAFYGCENLSTVVFRSYNAPILEEAYDAQYINMNNLPISGYMSRGAEAYKGLGIVKYFMWNVSSHGNNYYFGANFADYVGKVSRNIVMVSPANGVNYNSFIFSQYFGTKVLGANAATADTLKVIDVINALPDSITLADEASVTAARAAYDNIPALEQKALVSNYTRLTNAEATIRYLKYKEGGDESGSGDGKDDEKPAESGNKALLVAVIINTVLDALLIAAFVLYFFRTRKQKGETEEAADKKETPEDAVTNGETEEHTEEQADEEQPETEKADAEKDGE
ncbi:MAG: leucine-rich repeat protein, partial [Clostridia bacterium]|nr:leucine-rich repeat protein [Clostridia bacterium]